MFNNRFTKKDSVVDAVSQVLESWDDDEDDDVKRADAELRRMKAKPIEADKKTDPDKEIGKLAKKTPKEVDEAVSAKDAIGDIKKTLNDPKELSKIKGEPKKWIGPQKGDYGYPHSAGHGMGSISGPKKEYGSKKESVEVKEDKWTDVADGPWKKSKRTPGQASSAAANAAGKGLKGAQHKLDVAEPKGKLTAADFKKLRKEDAEQIEERSLFDKYKSRQRLKGAKEDEVDYQKDLKKSGLRDKSSEKKVRRIDLKLNKEESEQIDEISRDLATRYLNKAKGSMPLSDLSGKRKEGAALALKKKWGDKNFGLDEPKVKATEEVVIEKTLTPAESKKKEEIVKSMKKGAKGFKERYGKRAKEVMYATATKQAKKVAEETVTEAQGPTSTYSSDTFVQNANTTSNPTPLSRAKELARTAMSRMKNEMLGKAGTTSEEIDPSVKSTDTLKGRVAGGKKTDVGPGADGKSTKVKFIPGPK